MLHLFLLYCDDVWSNLEGMKYQILNLEDENATQNVTHQTPNQASPKSGKPKHSDVKA
jgi:hypothetical protein